MSADQNEATANLDHCKVYREESRKTSNDLLFEAVKELDGCLGDKTFARIIDGELKTEIQELRDRMETMRIKLNTPVHWRGRERSRIEDRGDLNVA